MPKKIYLSIEKLQELSGKGLTVTEIANHLNVSGCLIRKTLKNNNITINKPKPVVHTDETKRNLSEKRKQWLKDNPDKHPWRNKDKFKSKPCEKVKEFLTQLNISYIEEYQPEIDSRSFSIDIALPDKMIALEINGNQHYERDGTLKAYYQERHDLLEANGWDVYEIHYSACFNLDKWGDFIDKLSNANVKVEFDYFNYIPRTKKVKCCIDCEKHIDKRAIRCKPCVLKYFDIEVEKRQKQKSQKVIHNIIPKPVIHNIIPKPVKNKTEKIEELCKCGNIKDSDAKQCMACFRIKHRKVADRPNREKLEKLLWELPFTKLGEEYGVSDNAVRKWCKSYGITNYPPRGYFIKK
jgi:transposase